MDGISYPVKLHQIDRFEGLNQNMSVNVFAYEDDKIFPVRITENKGREHHVDLLVVNFSRLVSKQYKSHNGRLYLCLYCRHEGTSQRVQGNESNLGFHHNR